MSARTGYSATARFFHWATALFLLGLFPVGMAMTYRGKDLGIWDATTNALYSAHKLAGFILLGLVILRLGYRGFAGAPADEPSITPLQAWASHVTHWAMYGLLVAVPLTGWIGVSAFPALDTLFGLKLPALVGPDKDLAAQAFAVHGVLVKVLLGLIVLHIAGAIFHHFVKRDSVLVRMTHGRMRGDNA